MAINWSKLFEGRSRRDRRARQGARGRFTPKVEGLEDRWVPAVDVILEWNDVMLQANANDHARSAPEQGGPILAGRAFAIVSAAMYDAYNSAKNVGEKYLTFVRNARHVSADAAVAQAARDTLVALFPSQRALFNQELRETLDRVPNGRKEIEGRLVGAYVAWRILTIRSDDGATNIGSPAYDPPEDPAGNGLPGFHQKDPLHPTQPYYGSGGGNVDLFALRNVEQFDARSLGGGTPAGMLAFMSTSEYTTAYNEVKSLGSVDSSTRTADQTEIGIYWAYDGRPGLGTPQRLYNQIARTLAVQQHNTERENARMFALLNIAMADAGITAWYDKYQEKFWRPIMGVRYGADDGNPLTDGDPTWTPLGAPGSNPGPGETNADFTPPFPAYTSGHATMGAAAFQTLARFYGRDDISFTFTSDELNGVTLGADENPRALSPRSFDSLTEAKWENALSRIYLGIHWRFDATEGVRSGDRVANYVFNNFLRRGGHEEREGGGGGFRPNALSQNGAAGIQQFYLLLDDADVSPLQRGSQAGFRHLTGNG